MFSWLSNSCQLVEVQWLWEWVLQKPQPGEESQVWLRSWRQTCCSLFLLAGLSPGELHWAERAGAAVPHPVCFWSPCLSGLLERHSWCWGGQWHPLLDPEGARQDGGAGVGPDADPLPHPGLPHPGHRGRALGQPGGGGGGWGQSCWHPGLCHRHHRHQQSLPQSSSGVCHLPHRGTIQNLPQSRQACGALAQGRHLLPLHPCAGVQGSRPDRGTRGCHFSRGTALFRSVSSVEYQDPPFPALHGVWDPWIGIWSSGGIGTEPGCGVFSEYDWKRAKE